MKFRSIILNLTVCCLLSTAADTLLVNDAMSMPLRRTWTLSGQNNAAPWQKEQKVVINAPRLQIRFSRNSQPVQKFEIIEAKSGTRVFACSAPVKKLYFPYIKNPGEYILKISGSATGKPGSVFVESIPVQKGLLLIPSWNNSSSTSVENASPNGINLITSGKLNFMQTTLYDRLKAGQNYRMEFEVSTVEEQKVSIRARWGKGNSSFGNRTFTVKPIENGKVLSMDFTPQSSTVSLTIYCESKLQIRRFRLYAAAPSATVRSRMIGGSKAYFEHLLL